MLTALWRKGPAVAPEGEAPAQGPPALPAAIATTRRGALRLKEENAERRRDRNIRPDDPVFLAKEAEFAAQLAVPVVEGEYPTNLLHEPINRLAQVVTEARFTDYEQKLLYPVSRSLNPLLFSIQAEETKRFRALCGRRFQGKDVLTETKLAMLWFGLPIEPLPHNDFHGSGTTDLRLIDDVPSYAREEPLKFLNHYDNRTYEQDAPRTLPRPLPLFRALYRPTSCVGFVSLTRWIQATPMRPIFTTPCLSCGRGRL